MMGKIIVSQIIIFIICLLNVPSYGKGTNGATPFNFLFLDTGARPAALGGAYVSVSNDSNSLQYNPAGLANLKSHQATFMHNKYLQGANQQYVALGLKQGFGLSINTFNFGNLQRTTLSNNRGLGLDSFNIRDLVITAAYARDIDVFLRGISAGISVKYLQERIDSKEASAVAIDLGVLWDAQFAKIPVNFGASMQNLGSNIRFSGKQESLPINLKVGLACSFLNSGTLTYEVNRPKYGTTTMHVGTEYIMKKALTLRLGYNGRNEAGSGLTFGGGMIYQRFPLDYAFALFDDLGNTHKISLSYSW